jgi:V8-like Glu-specific endopeptidase
VREYWTAERMREAVPPTPLAGRLEAKRRGTIAKLVRHPGRRPNRSHGKVFFTLGGTNYVCSGTAVKAPAENVVWTAGHCVYDKPSALEAPRFATNWMFAPAYREGNSKFGRWVATDLGTTSQWANCGLTSCEHVAHDFGAANVARLGGRTLQDRVGGRPIQFNGPRDRTYKAIGYPLPGFGGQHMYACKSPYRGADSGQGSPPPMRITCDMTGGSSGGGWVAGGKVASVVSYGYDTEPNNLYGPYQGASAQSLYNDVKGG